MKYSTIKDTEGTIVYKSTVNIYKEYSCALTHETKKKTLTDSRRVLQYAYLHLKVRLVYRVCSFFFLNLRLPMVNSVNCQVFLLFYAIVL